MGTATAIVNSKNGPGVLDHPWNTLVEAVCVRTGQVVQREVGKGPLALDAGDATKLCTVAPEKWTVPFADKGFEVDCELMVCQNRPSSFKLRSTKDTKQKRGPVTFISTIPGQLRQAARQIEDYMAAIDLEMERENANPGHRKPAIVTAVRPAPSIRR